MTFHSLVSSEKPIAENGAPSFTGGPITVDMSLLDGSYKFEFVVALIN